MARFCGKIGYGESVEDPAAPGNWDDVITEIEYFGDIIRNTRNLESGEQVNDDISVGNSISVVADQFANENFHNIRYIWWMNEAWTVTSVEVKSPRLILSLGQVYNGPFPVEEP